jgi:ABC-type transporter Mla subunit MlaD
MSATVSCFTQTRRGKLVVEPAVLSQIFWSSDPATQRAVGIVLGLALVSASLLFLPLIWRLLRLFMFERRLRNWIEYAEATPPAKNASLPGIDFEQDELRILFSNSPIPAVYDEFERRWKNSRLTEGIDRAPIRLMDVLDDRPLLPYGPRRSLLPVMPSLFLGVGVFAALTGLIPSLGDLSGETLSGNAQSTWMANQLGLMLRASAWAFILAIGASLTGRLIEGAFAARSHRLDELIEREFGSISPGELAEITRQTQQESLETLGKELSGFANELNERLDRGLQRIEQSTARSANLVSQEQRGALHSVVQELSLSVRQGVEHHLGELRAALQKAVEHQSSVTGGLAETFERMVENSHTQDRVAQTLADSASSVEQAANAMRGSATEMRPILEHLSSTSRGMADTAQHMGDTQKVVARSAEGVRSSLEHAAAGVDDQRQFIEHSLTEIRHALVGLGAGLGDSLQRSLRQVDDALSGTVGQLRTTLSESNDTIERLAGPIRAAEGSTRETHVALDRVRGEVEALGQWLSQAVKPLRNGLSDVEGRAEDIAQAMNEFASHTRQIDKTMESLREEIHEESRRLQGTGSELSRRLKLTSDAVGMLDNPSAEDSRPNRSESPNTPPDRTWSPTPQSVDDEPRTSKRESPAREPSVESPAARPKTGEAVDRKDSAMPFGQEPVDSVPSEVAQSGYRVGAPRAQGPDPYSRFDGDAETPSNVRHFPTRDRELPDDLKLSSLLGPSSNDAETGQVQVSRSNAKPKAKAKSTDKTTPKNPSKATGKRRGSAKSSDDSE